MRRSGFAWVILVIPQSVTETLLPMRKTHERHGLIALENCQRIFSLPTVKHHACSCRIAAYATPLAQQ